MSATRVLVKKEIRLLLPALVISTLLAVAPLWLLVWLLPSSKIEDAVGTSLYLVCIGTIILALSSFGRELSLGTFSLMLTQPYRRSQIWWTKVALLIVTTIVVLGAWRFSCAACASWGYPQYASDFHDSFPWRKGLAIAGTVAAAACAGGLWTTLLVRQLAAAVWMTLLTPWALLMPVALIADGSDDAVETLVYRVLLIYAVAGFVLAWWQFARVQDVSWSGGELRLPSWKRASLGTQSAVRVRRPLAALLRKEVQLHQVSLIAMSVLFLFNLCLLGLRKIGKDSWGEMLQMSCAVLSAAWAVAPFLAGCLSIAEERRLGTLDTQVCLPVSRRLQFTLKLLFVLLLVALPSAALFWTVEGIGVSLGTQSLLSTFKPFHPAVLALLALGSAGLALAGLYASTLSRSVLQAFGLGMVTLIIANVLTVAAPLSPWLFGTLLWQGPLIFYFLWPALVGTLLWTAWRNFKRLGTGEHLWWRNLIGVAAALGLVVTLTTATYHRFWEWFTPLEPKPGPQRLAGMKPEAFHSYSGVAFAAVLPDGQLWVDRIAREPARRILSFGLGGTGFIAEGQWLPLDAGGGISGSNWADVAVDPFETVAIRSDGSLWVSEQPQLNWLWFNENGRPSPQKPARLVQFGSETNWQCVGQQHPYSSTGGTFLLKHDGTLWSWGTNSTRVITNWPGLPAFEPRLLVAEGGWTRMHAGSYCVYLWKADGRAWAYFPPNSVLTINGLEKEGFKRMPAFDDIRWQSLTYADECEVGVREDGTLWLWNFWFGSHAGQLRQLGKDEDWAVVAGGSRVLSALKTDGSLWRWGLPQDLPVRGEYAFARPPTRLGARNDWVGIGSTWRGVLSLAADGILCYWSQEDQPMLAPPRRPSRIENIFEHERAGE